MWRHDRCTQTLECISVITDDHSAVCTHQPLLLRSITHFSGEEMVSEGGREGGSEERSSCVCLLTLTRSFWSVDGLT